MAKYPVCQQSVVEFGRVSVITDILWVRHREMLVFLQTPERDQAVRKYGVHLDGHKINKYMYLVFTTSRILA